MQAERHIPLDFESFVQARSAGLFRTALLLADQDRAAAEDLLQTCMERAYRNWSRLTRPGADPERYARRILVNAANDRWRGITRRPERPLAEAGPDPVARDQAAELEDRDVLLRALATVPRQQRSALVLRYFDDLSDGDIAEALGCSPGTVRSHLSRGLVRLREAMQESTPASHPEALR
jgi:RNA polymerase sigma-70 factor (sigma-E family)